MCQTNNKPPLLSKWRNRARQNLNMSRRTRFDAVTENVANRPLVRRPPINLKYILVLEKLGIFTKIAYARLSMMESQSDEDLMLAYKGGEIRAFEILYQRYRQPLYRYFQHQCGSAAIAEELFQDIWMNLIRSRERYQVTASFKTFIYRLAHNRLIDHYRKQKHGIPSSYDENENILNTPETANRISPEQKASSQQQLNILLTTIDTLPAAQREAFLLKENSNLSVDDIARLTGVKPETAKSRIRYAINKLRQAIDGSDANE